MTTPLDQTRAEFEAKFGAKPYCWDLSRYPNEAIYIRPGGYMSHAVNSAWEAWQAAIASAWTPVADGLPKCDRKPDSPGVEVLIWPPHEDGSRTAFYGRRQTREPNFYKYGAVLNNVQFWQYAPTPPIAALAAKETT